MYGCELWDLNCNYVTDFKVAWRKIKHRIWRLPYRAHNVIVHSLSYDIDHQLDTRTTKFVYSCLNHSNSVCRSLLSSKLHCVRSTFAANYKYLSYKYNISQDEWFTDLSHLIKKVDIKFHKDFQNQSTVNTICLTYVHTKRQHANCEYLDIFCVFISTVHRFWIDF